MQLWISENAVMILESDDLFFLVHTFLTAIVHTLDRIEFRKVTTFFWSLRISKMQLWFFLKLGTAVLHYYLQLFWDFFFVATIHLWILWILWIRMTEYSWILWKFWMKNSSWFQRYCTRCEKKYKFHLSSSAQNEFESDKADFPSS